MGTSVPRLSSVQQGDKWKASLRELLLMGRLLGHSGRLLASPRWVLLEPWPRGHSPHHSKLQTGPSNSERISFPWRSKCLVNIWCGLLECCVYLPRIASLSPSFRKHWSVSCLSSPVLGTGDSEQNYPCVPEAYRPLLGVVA